MNSIGIWCDYNDHNAEGVHIDINIWLTKEEKLNYFELGIKCPNYKNLTRINIALPFYIKKVTSKTKLMIWLTILNLQMRCSTKNPK